MIYLIEYLKKHYGDPYHKAFDEIRQELETLGFEWIQEGIYVRKSEKNPLTIIYKAISQLSKIEWFKKSVRHIKAFKA